MMDGNMGWMMGGMMGTGLLIAVLVIAVLVLAVIALVRTLVRPDQPPANATASTTLVVIAIVGGLALVALVAAAGMCGGMFLGGSA